LVQNAGAVLCLKVSLLEEVEDAGAKAKKQRRVADEINPMWDAQPLRRTPSEAPRKRLLAARPTNVSKNTIGKATIPGDRGPVKRVGDHENVMITRARSDSEL